MFVRYDSTSFLTIERLFSFNEISKIFLRRKYDPSTMKIFVKSSILFDNL